MGTLPPPPSPPSLQTFLPIINCGTHDPHPRLCHALPNPNPKHQHFLSQRFPPHPQHFARAYCSGNCSGNADTSDEGGCYQSRLRVYQVGGRRHWWWPWLRSVVVAVTKSPSHLAHSNPRRHQRDTNGRSVFNNGHDGDTTVDLLSRYYQLLSANPGYVFLGLSLANEGIQGSDPDAVFAQYDTNMRRLISMARADGIKPVVGLCYPNSGYDADQYEYIKRMNLLVDANMPTPTPVPTPMPMPTPKTNPRTLTRMSHHPCIAHDLICSVPTVQ